LDFPEGERGWAGVDEINMEAAARDLGTYQGQNWETIETLRERGRRRERVEGEEEKGSEVLAVVGMESVVPVKYQLSARGG
jgi:hypothetical protein